MHIFVGNFSNFNYISIWLRALFLVCFFCLVFLFDWVSFLPQYVSTWLLERVSDGKYFMSPVLVNKQLFSNYKHSKLAEVYQFLRLKATRKKTLLGWFSQRSFGYGKINSSSASITLNTINVLTNIPFSKTRPGLSACLHTI